MLTQEFGFEKLKLYTYINIILNMYDKYIKPYKCV
jgi:hypothetical protein